jgi:hypothetical protein
MASLTNRDCGELVAQIHDIDPADLVGWIVLAITNDSQTRVMTNATSQEQLQAALKAAAAAEMERMA